MSTVQALRETANHRLTATIDRLVNPNSRFDPETRMLQHNAVYLNLRDLATLGYWEDVNKHFTRFHAYLKDRGEL